MVRRDQKLSRIDSLSRLGDPLTNFIYSLARTQFSGSIQGDKVSNSSLAIALRKSGLRDLAPSRADKHLLGDFVEAIIYYAWENNHLKIEEAAEIIAKNLTEDLNHRRKGKQVIGKAFSELLTHLNQITDLKKFYKP